MQKRNELTGQRFNQRVVLQFSGINSSGRGTWKARCDCGHEMVSTAQSLRRAGPCVMCGHKGPRPYRRKRPQEAIYNAFVARAHYPVSITYEQFVALTLTTECHYCGVDIRWIGNASNLDRKDNARPYDLSNVVVCCGRCNRAKNTHFSYTEWKQLGKVIQSWRALAMLQLEIEAEREKTS